MNYDRNKRADKNSESWSDFEKRTVKFWRLMVENYLTKETFK